MNFLKKSNYFIQLFFSDTQQGNCYTRVTSNQNCVEPLPMKLSKKDCCCGKDMGEGWGNDCEHCPSQGMGKYIVKFVNLTTSNMHCGFIRIYSEKSIATSIIDSNFFSKCARVQYHI